MNWPDLFRQRRVSMRLSMVELAALLGVTRQAVWAIESGASKPSVDIVMGLAQISGSIEIAAAASDAQPIASSDQKIENCGEIKK